MRRIIGYNNIPFICILLLWGCKTTQVVTLEIPIELPRTIDALSKKKH